jgi:hypothetical protein
MERRGDSAVLRVEVLADVQVRAVVARLAGGALVAWPAEVLHDGVGWGDTRFSSCVVNEDRDLLASGLVQGASADLMASDVEGQASNGGRAA